jgi:hypothetical protein
MSTLVEHLMPAFEGILRTWLRSESLWQVNIRNPQLQENPCIQKLW